MKKCHSHLTALAIAVLSFSLTACGSRSDAPEGYQGVKLNKSLIESVINHWQKIDTDKRFPTKGWSYTMNFCGDYVAVPGVGGDNTSNAVGQGYVLLDKEGNEISSSPDVYYGHIGKFSNGLAAYINSSEPTPSGKVFMGIMNTKGDQVLPAQYDLVGPWMEGKCIIVKDNQMGVYCDKGEIVIPLGRYQKLLCLDNGLIAASQSKNWCLLSAEGKELSSNVFQDLDCYKGMVVGKKQGKYGMLDKDLKEVVPFAFDSIRFDTNKDSETEGYLVLSNKQNRMFIDPNGQVFSQKDITKKFHPLVAFSETDDDGYELWGLKDREGNVVVPCKYDGMFEEGKVWKAGYNHFGNYVYFTLSGEKIADVNHKENGQLSFEYGYKGFFTYDKTRGEGNNCGFYNEFSGEKIVSHKYSFYELEGSVILAHVRSDDDFHTDFYSLTGKKGYSTSDNIEIAENGHRLFKIMNGYFGFKKKEDQGKEEYRTFFLDYNGNFLFEIVSDTAWGYYVIECETNMLLQYQTYYSWKYTKDI